MGWIAIRPAGEAFSAQAWAAAAILAWNLAMTGLASANARLPSHRFINVAVDVLLAAALYWLQGGLGGITFWVAWLPILTSAVYFEIGGVLLVTVLVAGLMLAREAPRLGSAPGSGLAWMGATLAVGALLGGILALLMRGLRQRRRVGMATDEARHRAENERLRAIYELTSTLTATLSYKSVLEAALDLSYKALDPGRGASAADQLVGVILLFRGGQLQIGASRRLTSADVRTVFAAGDGLLKRAFDQGEAVLAEDVGKDPELRRVVALRACRSAYCCPLRSGFNVYGALLFAHPAIGYFTPVRRDVLDIMARQATVAIQNARLYQDLVEEKERMVEVHEEARKKLARDLHDGPTQSVAAMAMRISMVRRLLETDPAGAEAELAKIADLAERAGKEIRHTLFTLRPLILESQGLCAAVRTIAEKMRDTFDQNVVVEMDEQLEAEMEPAKQGLLFYIVEEAMTNARKHANAAMIWVRLHSQGRSMALLEIEDNGVGFDVSEITNVYDKRSSLGLINLRERADLVNGRLEIRSTIGTGTRVAVHIPLTREAAERMRQPDPAA